MKKIIKIFILSVLCSVNGILHAQDYDLSEKLTRNPNIVYGKLDNGLSYYILHNEEPKERASFYMIQNVGAILENDNQNGLAHFLEHMAFNGTKQFPGKAIISSLEKKSIAFGRDVNAYTAHDQTVYNISNVPTKSEGLLDTCLLVLHDWSNYLLLTEEEIDSERGVISEEWRTRRNLDFRLRSKTNAAIFKDSKYATRDVIGDLDIIKNFEYNTIREFYHDWYRTDLQAIAIVGDVNVKEIEKKIKTLFTSIPAIENPKPRPEVFEIPEHEKPYFVLATDEEASTSKISVLIMHKDDSKLDNYNSLKSNYLNSLIGMVLNERLKEFEQIEQPPYFSSYVGYSNMVRAHNIFYFGCVANANKENEALELLYTEVERARRFGFTDSEVNRAKANFKTRFENYYQNRDKISNDSYCKSIVKDFTIKQILADVEDDYKFAQWMLQNTDLNDFNARIKEWITPDNRIISVTGPATGVNHITENEALLIMQKVEESELEKYIEKEITTSLITQEIKGGKVVLEKNLEKEDAIEWTLSNGAKVVFKNIDLDKDLILLKGFSKGGKSLYKAKDIPNTELASGFVSEYGLGDYDAISLNKVMAGKKAGLKLSIGDKYEYVNGNSSVKDFETVLQLLYLRFEHPRFDEKIFNQQIKKFHEAVALRYNNSSNIMRDSLNLITTNYNPRTRLFNEQFINDIKLEEVEKIYRERYSDASDFTFVIVGNISIDVAKPLIEKYIGSITDIERNENWLDKKVEGPNGITEKTITIPMNTPKGNVNILYDLDLKFSRKNKLSLDILSRILTLRYTESIREKEGGTYGVSVRPKTNRLPKGSFSLAISFDCDPDKAEHLKSIIFKEIKQIIDHGPSQEDLNKVLGNMKKSNEQNKNNNNYWAHVLQSKYMFSEDVLSSEYFDDIINNLSISDIKKFTKSFFKKADLIDIVFLPESNK